MKQKFLMLFLTAMLMGLGVSAAVGQSGACCYFDGTQTQCVITDDEDYCSFTLYGAFYAGATCDDLNPQNGIADICEAVPEEGACCYFDGTQTQCVITDDEDYCSFTLFGAFHAGATCEDMYPQNGIADICETGPQEGTCCYSEGEDLLCMITDNEIFCQDTLNGDFYSGATCDDVDPQNGIADICEPASFEGACCYLDGDDLLCMITDDEFDCTWSLGGEFHLGATCEDVDPQNGIADVCENQALGACCINDRAICVTLENEAQCIENNGIWGGAGTNCTDADENGIADICEGPGPFNYLPGDANMSTGNWPPSTIGGDVTYLVNYFRGITAPCMLDGFYASADANGSCSVTGADVTKLVSYFRGMDDLNCCPDYPTTWPPIPDTAPDGWPNCASPVLSK